MVVCSLNSSSASTLGKIDDGLQPGLVVVDAVEHEVVVARALAVGENDAEARHARLPAPSMFAPGMPRSTPGTVRVRLTKLRPFSGSASICSLVTVVPSSDEDVWSSGAAASTLTDSVIAPTSSLRSMRTR